MATSSERKSAFSAIALASQFLHEAEKLGVTPAQLQRLRESPVRMEEFAQLAKSAEEDYHKRVARLQYEKECAVNIDGVHYHLVLITPENLEGWGCKKDALISEAVITAASQNYKPLHEDAYATVERTLQSVTSQGQWIGWTLYGGLVHWERNKDGVKSLGSFGDITGMLLSYFSELRGVVVMRRSDDCDYRFITFGDC